MSVSGIITHACSPDRVWFLLRLAPAVSVEAKGKHFRCRARKHKGNSSMF